MQLLQCTASLPGGSGQCNSCNALPHCLGAVGSGTPTMHCRTAWGQWAVQLTALHCPTAWGQWAVQILQCTASLPGGSGQWNSCNALPDCLGAVGSATPATHCLTAWGQWTVELLHALPHCLGAVGSATPAMHCLTAWGQWAVQFLQCTASLPGGSRQWNSCNALPHCPGGSGQWNFCNALPQTPAMHCLIAPGAVGSAIPAMHCPTAWGQWAVQLLQRTASLPGGSGQWNSCNALPHCLGGSGQCNFCNALPHRPRAVGSGTPAMHCLTAWEQWAVQLLQCTASLP